MALNHMGFHTYELLGHKSPMLRETRQEPVTTIITIVIVLPPPTTWPIKQSLTLLVDNGDQ